MFEEYYLSDDPSDLGNFINGRLEFPQGGAGSDDITDDEEDKDPGLVDHRANSSTSLHSMDDDLHHPELENHHNGLKKEAAGGRVALDIHSEDYKGREAGPMQKMLCSLKSCCVL